MTTDRVLLLSLRPRFAKAILDGTKRVELRRIRPRAVPGTAILIYATAPTKALLGGCSVSGMLVADPDEIWEMHGHLTSVDRAEFDDYFAGTDHAVAIQLTAPWTLAKPITLDTLRQKWDGFHPPQTFRYLRAAAVRGIVPPTQRRSTA